MLYQGTAYLCYQGACQSTQGDSYGYRLQCHMSAGIGAAQISITYRQCIGVHRLYDIRSLAIACT